MIKIYEPNYVPLFRCTTSECEDTCCSGWRVIVNREAYDKYESIPDKNIKNLIKSKVIKNPEAQSDEHYAEIKFENNKCSLLTKEGLCSIHGSCGEEYLCLTCNNFPRIYNNVDGRIEKSLDMSCSEVANLALFNKEPMKLIEEELEEDKIRTGKVPVLNSNDSEYKDKPYKFFNNIRNFTIELLQNRSYSLENRIVILGLFCRELGEISCDLYDINVPNLIEQYNKRINGNHFDGILKSIPNQPAVLLKTMITLFEYRLKVGFTNEPFLECFRQFKTGLEYSEDMLEEDLKEAYEKAKSSYYEPFINSNEHILENYFVNYVFKTLFPLGPQKAFTEKGMYMVQKSIFSEYMILAIIYAMIKYLLVGISAYYKDEFGQKQIVRLISAFTKNIEHDVPYFKKLLEFFEGNNMLTFACATMLVKN